MLVRKLCAVFLIALLVPFILCMFITIALVAVVKTMLHDEPADKDYWND